MNFYIKRYDSVVMRINKKRLFPANNFNYYQFANYLTLATNDKHIKTIAIHPSRYIDLFIRGNIGILIYCIVIYIYMRETIISITMLVDWIEYMYLPFALQIFLADVWLIIIIISWLRERSNTRIAVSNNSSNGKQLMYVCKWNNARIAELNNLGNGKLLCIDLFINNQSEMWETQYSV